MRLAKFNKFRNAVASPAPREAWYSELAADADGLAIDGRSLYVRSQGGNSLVAIDIDCSGKVDDAQAGVLPGSAGKIVDWSTAQHEDCLVAAVDSQGTVAVWKDHMPVLAFRAHSSAGINVNFHPTVAGVLASSANTGSNSGEVCLWNVETSTEAPVWRADTSSGLDSFSLRGDGQLLAASTRAGTCTILDPRMPAASDSTAGTTPAFHAPGRPTRVLWAGEKPFLITTGLTKMRERSAALWDQRNLAQPLASLRLQPSAKPLVPLYDEDTCLAYLVEKGDISVRWVDADPSSASPLAQLGSVVLPSPIGGSALLPKRRLRVMSGEIARMHVVVNNTASGQGTTVIPIPHIAPRKTYLDFHSDLFPDTRAPLPVQTFEQWMAQEPVRIPRMSLDPAKTEESLAALRRAYCLQPDSDNSATASAPMPAETPVPMPAEVPVPALVESMTSSEATSVAEPTTVLSEAEEEPITAPDSQLQPPVKGLRTNALAEKSIGWKLPKSDHARFKYLEGFAYRPTEHFTNLRNVNLRFSQQNDPVRVGSRYIAVSLTGAGGRVGVLRRDLPGRVSDNIGTIVHGADVVDIGFDPFDPAIVTTAGADGRLQMWRIPDTPLSDETLFELEEYVHVTADRIYQMRFNPCAQGIVGVLVSDGDMCAVHIYNGLRLHFIVGKTADTIHCFEWSPSGDKIALTTRKTKQLHVYDARTQDLLASGSAMDSVRPSRIAWMGNSRICLAGFGSGSRRQLSLYNVEDLTRPLSTATIDVGPGVLAPIADVDTGIVYLDDRGSRLTHAFEVVGDQLFELPKLELPQPSLGMAALPKMYANVAQCEVLRAYRLSAQSLESIGFRVPRKRPEFFQNDIFPDTVDTEIPAIDTQAWLNGDPASPRLISLCPRDMKPLSEAPPEVVRKRVPAVKAEAETDNTKDTISAMLNRIDETDEESEKSADSGSDWGD
ncbi:hypothetical protein H4S02_004727 [Coemansia sp. RSA 2611]|nr:hypothetical protein H4S02_004727 [Coemansia sp. RSA 2611]